jgi:hypothetical protein
MRPTVSEQPFGDVADVEGEMDGPLGGKTCLHLFLCRDKIGRYNKSRRVLRFDYFAVRIQSSIF